MAKKKSTKAKPKRTTTRKRGRPAGAKNKQRDVVPGALTRCKMCGSTDRTKYEGEPRLMISGGVDQDGNPYNVVSWRRTSCATCGQHRIDQFFEMRPELE